MHNVIKSNSDYTENLKRRDFNLIILKLSRFHTVA